MDILSLIAHPDDLEIAAAGTICKLTENQHRVFIGIVTDELDTRMRAIRTAEAVEAAGKMGVPESRLLFLGQEDRFASDDDATATVLQIWMKAQACNPDVVITHSKNDTHQDHRAVHCLALSATRQSAAVYLFAAVINSLRKPDFKPTVFVDTSRQWARKIDALACYPSQDALGRIRVNDIKNHESHHAKRFGVSRVEAFEALITNRKKASNLLDQFALRSATTEKLEKLSNGLRTWNTGQLNPV